MELDRRQLGLPGQILPAWIVLTAWKPFIRISASFYYVMKTGIQLFSWTVYNQHKLNHDMILKKKTHPKNTSLFPLILRYFP